MIPGCPLKVVVGLLGLAKTPLEPPTSVHMPVPDVGVLAARVTVESPQVAVPVWSGPALATGGAGWTVMVKVTGVPGQVGPVMKLPMATGPAPTPTVPTTALVAVWITVTLLEF